MAPLKLPFISTFHFCPFLLLLFLFILQTPLLISSLRHNIPILSPHIKDVLRRNPNEGFAKTVSKDYTWYYYNQTLDHFNYGPQSYETFQQRYVVNAKHWKGPNSRAPIFAYLGAEEPIDYDLEDLGFVDNAAPIFNSLSVFIEHRFYGKSIPFGTTLEEALKNSTTRGYFSSAQALADYAAILLHLKSQFSAKFSPIIVAGGSYGGMLASSFRLKYPHIALGALASSAPILYFDDITPQNGYYSVVTKDFKEVSENCYETIRKSWGEIDRVASHPDGLSILSQNFKICSKLNNSLELKDYLDSMYSTAAQYNSPPNYPVNMICKGIDDASSKESDNGIIGKIAAGVASFFPNSTCYNMTRYSSSTQTNMGWRWQTCSEMVIPIGRGENDTMFPADPFNIEQFAEGCMKLYGVPPRPHWITTYYGGHDIKLILKRFGSNIIFSNGLKDPYSIGGVLEDLSESIVAITTVNGSHCLDIQNAAKTDPEWLLEQRNTEIKIIQGWLAQYYDDLTKY